MFLIRVQNKSPVSVSVPLSAIVPDAKQAIEQAQPDGWASCLFSPPTSNFEAQNAVVAWAHAAGIEIEVVIELVPTVDLDNPPEP
jgi:hypothetical protein